MLCKLKSKIPTLQINDTFYSIPCNDCDSVYVGETIRPRDISLEKYKKLTNSKNYNQNIVNCSIDSDHIPDFENI